jgi:beta-galactosidase
MKRYIIGIVLSFVTLSISLPLCARTVISINESWRFAKSAEADVSQADVSSWQAVNIPHTWNAQDAYVEKNYFRGSCWYAKEFSAPTSFANKSVYLQFEGVQSYAQVFLNGKLLGEHKGGYTAFGFDISNALLIGQKNRLMVKVNNENKEIAPLHGDFTIWGGIYRDVYLTINEKVHIGFGQLSDKGVQITTPKVSEKLATVNVKTQTENNTSNKQNIILLQKIFNQKDELISTVERKVELRPNEKKIVNINFSPIANPQLWSPDSPTLYKVKTSILDAKTKLVTDEITNQIGFRWYSIDPEKGFFLNGKHLKLVGVNRHQDFDELGSALTDDFHRRDVQLMKDMGVNFLRIAHYPQDNALLNECDKQGIVVWEEISMVDYISINTEFYDNCKQNLEEMIAQHFNHPSVVMWGFMNEIFLRLSNVTTPQTIGLFQQKTVEIAQKLNQVAKEKDPSRFTTIALHIDSAYRKAGLCDVTDILGWNVYKGWYGDDIKDFATYMDTEHRMNPHRPLIVSEYGAGSDRRIHSQKGRSFDFSTEYQQQFHEAYLPYILERDYIAASSMWNMNDFGSADRDESMPRINNKGLLYYNRTPKDVFYYYKSMLSKSPVAHIATRDWDKKILFEDKATAVYPVKIYSNQKEVELFVNNKSMGVKQPTNCTVVFDVPFSDGKSTLIAKSKGVEDATVVECEVLPSDLRISTSKSLEIGVNCGVQCDFTDDKSKFTWLADRAYEKGKFGYIGGEMYQSKPWVTGFIDQISGTRNVPLFQTIRLGATAYQFDLPDGEYEVELSFTEPKSDGTKIPTENVFDVVINGEIVLADWNIAENGGRLFAITKKIATKSVENKGIRIDFLTKKGKSLVSAIKVCRIK